MKRSRIVVQTYLEFGVSSWMSSEATADSVLSPSETLYRQIAHGGVVVVVQQRSDHRAEAADIWCYHFSACIQLTPTFSSTVAPNRTLNAPKHFTTQRHSLISFRGFARALDCAKPAPNFDVGAALVARLRGYHLFACLLSAPPLLGPLHLVMRELYDPEPYYYEDPEAYPDDPDPYDDNSELFFADDTYDNDESPGQHNNYSTYTDSVASPGGDANIYERAELDNGYHEDEAAWDHDRYVLTPPLDYGGEEEEMHPLGDGVGPLGAASWHADGDSDPHAVDYGESTAWGRAYMDGPSPGECPDVWEGSMAQWRDHILAAHNTTAGEVQCLEVDGALIQETDTDEEQGDYWHPLHGYTTNEEDGEVPTSPDEHEVAKELPPLFASTVIAPVPPASPNIPTLMWQQILTLSLSLARRPRLPHRHGTTVSPVLRRLPKSGRQKRAESALTKRKARRITAH
ncbi:hypothetical protein C8R45DRAFT_930570 [Mycena sanguinolenta]|nr:hypothetical protein C8R45DRAFT_930570 [Mycena sanguinolenta]